MNPRTTRGLSASHILLLIIGLALVVRIVYLLQYQQSMYWDQLTVDNWYHHNWANSLAEGNVSGDTTYFRAPFYVYCLGLLYAVFGSSLWVARLFGLTVGLASVAMTFALGRKLADVRTGAIAAALHAVYPLAVYFEGELLLDSLFMLLVQISVFCFLRWLDTKSRKDLLWTGLAIGLAAITRPTILVAVPLVFIWVVVVSGWRSGIRQLILFVAGLGLILAPVFLRNIAVANDPVLIASQGGINLYIGNNDAADGSSAALPEPLGYNWTVAQVTWQAEKSVGHGLKPGEVSDYWRARALDWIGDHPGRFLQLYAKKIYYQFADLEISNNRSIRSFFESISILKYNPLSFGLVLSLAALGALATWRRNRGMAFVLALVCLYVVTVSLFFYSSRFRLPLLPYYFVLAAAGAGLLRDRIVKRSRKLTANLGLAVLAGVFSFSTVLTVPYAPAPQTELSAGLVNYRNQDYREALAHFQAAHQMDPEFPEVNLNIGACYFRLGLADSARHYFERERTLHPGRAKVYHNLASFDLVNGRYQEAVDWSRTAIEIAPYDITANILLVRALGADTAITNDSLWNETLGPFKRTEMNLYFLNEAAAVFSRRGDLRSAEHLSGVAIDANPPPIETDPLAFGPNFRNAREPFAREKAKAWHLLGYIAGLEGRLEDAVHNSEQAVGHDPDFEEAYLNLITALRADGQLVRADSLLRAAVERFPANPLFRQLQPLSR